MNLSRRLFCEAGLGAISSPLLVGKSAGQNEVTVSGQLSSQADTDVSGLEFYLSNVKTSHSARLTVDSSGDISTTVSETGKFRVTVYDYSPEFNKLPAVYSFSEIDIDEEGNIGEFTLPEAHQVDIRCLDTKGNPIENLPVNFRAPNGTGMSPGTFTTTTEGYVKYTDVDQPGVELVDKVDIEVQLPSNPDVRNHIRTVNVPETEEIEISISHPEQYTSTIRKVAKNPEAGFQYPYYLYTPSVDQVTSSGNSSLDSINPRPLLVMFRTWDSKSQRIEKIGEDMNARDSVQRGLAHVIADELNIPALVALLPDGTPEGKFEVLNRDALQISEPRYKRLDLQLFSMVDDAKQRLANQPYDIADKIHLEGFSSNGLLCSQLTMLHPERINAVSSGGYGYHPIPKSEYQGDIPVQSKPETTTLSWPVGVADIAELTGKEFDKEAWLETAQFCYIGGEDQGNSDKSDLENDYIHARSWDTLTPSRDRRQLLYDIFGWENVDERFTTSRQIYETVGADSTFKIYEGIEHDRTNQMASDIVSFHREQMVSEFPTGKIQSSDPVDNESAETTSGSTTDTQPGFGLIHTIATIGGLGYLLQNRTSSESD